MKVEEKTTKDARNTKGSNPYDDMFSHPTGATYMGSGMYIQPDGSVVSEEELWG